MFKSFKWALLLILFTANVLSAATYYVSNTGSDSNSGSQSAPWLTVGKAAVAAAAGDTVNIAAGTYSGNVTFNNSGSVGSPIAIIGNGNVVITGNITMNGNYVTLAGVTCSPPTAGGYNAITVQGVCDILTNCQVANYGATASDQATAIGIYGASNVIVNCTIHDLNDIDATHVWGHDNLIDGLLVTNVNQVNYALNHTDFVQTWGYSSSAVAYNITFLNCVCINSTCQAGNTETDGANLHDWTFENCKWINVANTFFSGVPNTKFYNCVFDNVGVNQGMPIYWYASTVAGSQRSSAGCEVDNTVFYNCSPMAGNGVSVSTIVQTDNYSGSSPGFVNEAAGDYHLAAGSPLIGAGANYYSVFTIDANGKSRPSSGVWDIGAYEYTSSGTPAAAIQVTPTSVAFGTVLSGTSATNSFTVRNVGNGILSGAASVGSSFTIVSGGSYSLSSNQSQTVTVSFNPTTAGSYSQNVTLTGGGGANVGLTATATNAPVNPAIQVSPGSVTFGTILSGGSKTGSFTVKNAGGGTLSGAASVASPFSIVSGGTYNLSSNQSQTVTVSFNPTTAGSYSQNVTLTGGGGASVSLTATATNAPVNPAIQVTPTSVAFETILSGGSKTGSFTVRNIGGGALSGTASVASPFSIVSGGSYSLTSNQSQTVTVSFNPATAGSYSQNVTLTGGGGATVGLTASATNAPLIIPTVSAISVNVTDVDLALAGLQIYSGTTVQFSATATNAQTWQWTYSVNGGSPVVYRSGTGAVTNANYYFGTNTVGNSYDWTLVVSNGQAGAVSSTNLAVESLPNPGTVITNIIQGPTIAATSGILSSLLTASTVINGVLTSYFYQPLPSIGNTSGGTATYNVTITNAGNYEIQALVYAPNTSANSFLVNIDGQPQNPTMIWDIMPVTSGFEQRLVSWRGTAGSENNDSIVPKVFTLGAGPHQIVFVGREPGTAMASFTLQQVVTTIQSPTPPATPSGLRIISSAP